MARDFRVMARDASLLLARLEPLSSTSPSSPLPASSVLPFSLPATMADEFRLQEECQNLQDVVNYPIPQEHDVRSMDNGEIVVLLEGE